MALARSNILNHIFKKSPSSCVFDTTLHLPLCAQVRYRKPKWLLPRRAPSKQGMYFKKPRPTAHDEMKGDIMYKTYNELLKSIAAAFQEEILLKEADKESKIVAKEGFDEEAHHAKCMAYNDACNAEMKKNRESLISEKLQNQEILRNQKVEFLENTLSPQLMKFEQECLTAIDEADQWVTEENLEQKIIEALDNKVNFNFAVNTDGKIALRTVIP